MDITFAPPPSRNGHAASIDQSLVSVLTEGYRPSLPLWAYGLLDTQLMLPIYLFREIEIMVIHPVVRNALRYFKGAIAGATFEGPKDLQGNPKPISDNPEVADFVMTMCRRFWDRGVPKLQNGYEYGWIGVENIYGIHEGGQRDGLLEWEGCMDFHPRDCFLLTQNSRPIGLRVQNIVRAYTTTSNPSSRTDLWFSEGSVPAKGLWYPHQPRYNRFYGQSQLLGAWRPYRRLAGKDAAETVIDGGFYRVGYSGPIIRFPEEDMLAQTGTPSTTAGADGRPWKYARDYAKFMADQMKSGASLGLPSTKYPPEFGGDFKWDASWPQNHFNGEPLIAYIEYLIKQVREGVGVPNELIEAAETGSGYSGRAIPLEGFLQQQQEIANAMLHLFVIEVIKPLVLWNRDYFQQFGTLDFEVCVANLLETKLKAAMNPGGAAPGMQAGAGQEDASQLGAETAQPGAEGVTWSPHQEEGSGKQGWKSSNGLIRYTQTPPGQTSGALSHEDDGQLAARVQDIARAILEAA